MAGMVHYRIELIEAHEVPKRTFIARIANAARRVPERASASVLRALRETKSGERLVGVVKFANPPYRLPVSGGKGGTADAHPSKKRGGIIRNTGKYDVKSVQERLMATRIRTVKSRAYRTAIELKQWEAAGKIIADALAVESDLIIGEQIQKEWGMPDNASGLPASVLLAAEAGLQMAGDTQDSIHSSEFINDVRAYAAENHVTTGNKEGQAALTGHVAVKTYEKQTGEKVVDKTKTQSGQGEDIWAEIQDIFDSMIYPNDAGGTATYYDRKDGFWSPADMSSGTTDPGRDSQGRTSGEEDDDYWSGSEDDEDDDSEEDDEEDDSEDDDEEDESEDNEEENGEEEEEEPDEEDEDQNPEDDQVGYLAEFEMTLDQLFGGGQRTRQQNKAISLAAGGGFTDPGDQGDEKSGRRLVRNVNLDGYRFLSLGEYTMLQLVQDAVDAGTGVHAGGRSLRPCIPWLTKLQLDAILLMIGGGVTDPPETDDRTPPGRAPTDDTMIPRIIIRPPKARFAVITLVTHQ